MMGKHKKMRGFTIIELLIATAVFSIVLVVAVSGFVGVGRLFYKGIAVSTTQQVGQQILSDMTSGVSTSNNVVPGTSSTGTGYFCIGNNRYTYSVGTEVVRATESFTTGSGTGLVKDQLSGGSACAIPCPTDPSHCSSGQVSWQNPVEMLGDKMRLESISVQPVSTLKSSYAMSVTIAYGDDSVFNNVNDPVNIACNPQAAADAFCSVAKFNTSVYKGIQT